MSKLGDLLPTQENPVTLCGPEMLIFLRDNDRAMFTHHSWKDPLDSGSLSDSGASIAEGFLTREYQCWIEPEPKYRVSKIDAGIYCNDKAMSLEEIAALLNELDT